MDITSLFKASLKTARLRNSALPAPDKNRILKRAAPKSEFTQKTLDIRHQITQLKNLLLENRSAYMRFGYHLKSAVQMSDTERDIIDEESEKILAICTQFIGDLRTESGRCTPVSKQAIQHRDAVLELLAEYLRAVYRIYQQQKEYRVRHELDTYKLLKLESNRKLIPVIPGRDRSTHADVAEHSESDVSMSNGSRNDSDSDDGEDERIGGPGNVKPSTLPAQKDVPDEPQNRLTSYRSFDEDYGSNRFELDAEEMSADDIQVFESENVQLYNEFKGLSDEVEQIEKNVVDIAKLQDIFTEKVSACEIFKRPYIRIIL